MRLSSIFSDGMVLQRNKIVTVSGKAKPLQLVTLSFLGTTYETTSDQLGHWSIDLDELDAGGPFEMEIICEEKIVIRDILVGDVWILGGQSNMELPVKRTLDLFSEEVKDVNLPSIRHFSVPQTYNFHGPTQMLEGGVWTNATGDDILNFSAVGYFFAKELYEKYGVPIGLIQSAVGGTPIEAWISETTLRQLGGYDAELAKIKDDSYVAETKQNDEERQNLWYTRLNSQDEGLKNEWYLDSSVSVEWTPFEVPNSFEGTDHESFRGAVWFKKELEVPASMLKGGAKLMLGTIIDADDTYVNGIRIGSTGYRYPPRRYIIPEGLLTPGKNTIAVRVISTQSTVEFIKEMPYKLVANGEEISLEGTWNYKIGAKMDALESSTFFQYKPTGVFNGMISPLANYTINGVLWYQGESNTGNPKGYSNLFEGLVKDWRENWKQDDLPFLFTQLANLHTGAGPTESNWAELREEQRKSLSIPNTAMAVTIDVGEHNDLHPQDKKTVGQRLALCAQNKAYDEVIIYSGPLYKKMEIVGSSIHISFDQTGSGLVARGGGELRSFTICGEDGKYVPATAVIQNDIVVVSSDDVNNPCHIRYAWSDNPEEANLYNHEGLPASPFSTQE